MKIIEKIEIKHFRSFDGGRGKGVEDKSHIENIEDLNIFSGANDSGKSNILRALNVFFYNEITPGIKFNMKRDFSKIVSRRFEKELKEKSKIIGKEVRRSEENVSIKIHFHKHGYKSLPKKFWVTKIFSKKNNYKGEFQFPKNISKGVKLAQVNRFINNINFEYVPAIKDKMFFNELFKKLQEYLFENENKETENSFQSQSKAMNETLIHETSDLFKNFFESSNIKAEFEIPETLIDFFRTLKVSTGGDRDISLFDRGDGVQAKFIPVILDKISKNKKNTIWGFEEPENSYESGNIKAIRDDFVKKYSSNKQIFLTTHAEEFLSAKRIKTEKEKEIENDSNIKTDKKRNKELDKLKGEDKSGNISIYRVWKNKNDISIVTKFDEKNNQWEKIVDEMGIDIISDSRAIQKLGEELELERKKVKESGLSEEKQKIINKKIKCEKENCLNNLDRVEKEIEEQKKIILFVEDDYVQIYKIAYLKIKNIEFNTLNLDEMFKENSSFKIKSEYGAEELYKTLNTVSVGKWDGKKIVGLFDFDIAYNKFYGLKSDRWGDVEGCDESGLWRKRKDSSLIFSLLLPVPELRKYYASKELAGNSILEIELYFEDDVLQELGNLGEEPISGSPEKRKVFKGKKSEFWKKLIDLNKDKFKNFTPLFEKIEKLFES